MSPLTERLGTGGAVSFSTHVFQLGPVGMDSPSSVMSLLPADVQPTSPGAQRETKRTLQARLVYFFFPFAYLFPCVLLVISVQTGWV